MKSSSNPDALLEYNISLSEDDLQAINQLINTVSGNVYPKKQHKQKFTLLKNNHHHFFLIGNGPRQFPLSKNAFLGEGNSARVKVTAALVAENGYYYLSSNIYAAKIYKNDKTMLSKIQNEALCYQKLYGFSDVIIKDDQKVVYLLMPKVPGVKVCALDYTKFNTNDLTDLIVAVLRALSHLQAQSISHDDISDENVLYDFATKTINFIDFETSKLTCASRQDILYIKALVNEIIERYSRVNRLCLNSDAIREQINEMISSLFPAKSLLPDDLLMQLKDELGVMLDPGAPQVDFDTLTPDDFVKISTKDKAKYLSICIQNDEQEILSAIIPRCDASILTTLHNGVFPLVLAIQTNNENTVKLLLEAGADVNQLLDAMPQYTTLLHAIVMEGLSNYALIALLLEKNPNIDIPNNAGQTVRELLETCSDEKLKALFVEKGLIIPNQSVINKRF